MKETKQGHHHPEQRHDVCARAMYTQVAVQIDRPSQRRRVIQQIRGAASSKDQHTHPHDCWECQKQEDDPLRHNMSFLKIYHLSD